MFHQQLSCQSLKVAKGAGRLGRAFARLFVYQQWPEPLLIYVHFQYDRM